MNFFERIIAEPVEKFSDKVLYFLPNFLAAVLVLADDTVSPSYAVLYVTRKPQPRFYQFPIPGYPLGRAVQNKKASGFARAFFHRSTEKGNKKGRGHWSSRGQNVNLT